MQNSFNKKTVKVQTIFGEVIAYENDLITSHLLEFGAHGRSDLAFLLSVIEEGDKVFDLGAHIGTYSIPIAKKIKEKGKLLAIEGVSETHDILVRNVINNSLSDRVITQNAVVAPSLLNLKPIIKPSNTGGTMFQIVSEPHDNLTSSSVGIEQLSKMHFIPRVIKLDIEGFEYMVLQGSLLTNLNSPILFLEVCEELLEKASSNLDDLNQLLFSQGYRLFKNLQKVRIPSNDFSVGEVNELKKGEILNVLAVHKNDQRIEKLLKKWNS